MSGAGTVRREVVRLPLPRLVQVELRLQRRPEPTALAVVDDVDVALPDLRDADAPVALELPAMGHQDRETWRVFDGRFYRPFLCRDGVGAAPAEAASRFIARLRHQMGIREGADANYQGQERLLDALGIVDRAERAHGLARLDERPVRRVVEDGLGRRAGDVAAVAANLVLVDGRLHHAAPAPGYLLRGADGDVHSLASLRAVADAPYLAVPGHQPAPRNPWCAFEPDRADELDAFLDAIPAADWFPVRGDPRPTRAFRVVDGEALASALPAPTLRGFVLECLDAYLALCGPRIHSHPDGTVADYLAARLARGPLAAGGDAEAGFAALRRLVEAVDAGTPVGREGFPSPIVAAGRCLTLRHDLIERPRHGLPPLASPDEDALSSLSPSSAP